MKIELTDGDHPNYGTKYIIETDNIIAFWDDTNTNPAGYDHCLTFLLAVDRGQPSKLEIKRWSRNTSYPRENLWGDVIDKIYQILKPIKL